MRRFVCYLYAKWLAHVVATKQSPWVVTIDKLWGGGCQYCSITRALLAGLGLGVLTRFDLLGSLCGAGLLALSFALTYVERRWLCNQPKDTK